MKKRLLSIILITMFIVCGCSSNNAVVESANAMTDTVETQPVEESEEATEQPETTEETDVPEETEATEEIAETEEAAEPTQDAVSEAENATVEDIVEESKVVEQTTEALEESKETEPEAEVKPQEEVKTEQPKQESSSVNNEQTAAPAPQPAPAPTPEPTPAPHTCTWDGGTVTTNATCTSEGIKTFKCSGCGSTRTESIAKTSHNYVTESTPATCTAAGTTKTYCSICGNVQSESAGAAATGHTSGAKTWAWGYEGGPTCRWGASYYINCAVCNETLETGWEPALPHTEVVTVNRQPTCRTEGSASIDCSVCGSHIRNELIACTDEHNWVATEYDVFNEDTLEWEKIPGEYCTVCNRQR